MRGRALSRGFVGALLVAALVTAGCTSPPDAPSVSTSPVTVTVPATGVALRDARLTVMGADGSLSGELANDSPTSYRVTAITCACASDIQLGAVVDGAVTPVVGGVVLPANGTTEIGTSDVTVSLTDVLPAVTSGATVPVIVYFADHGSITGTAVVG